MFLSEKEPIGPQPCPVLYTVSSPARGLLDREKVRRTSTKLQLKRHKTNQKKKDRVQETDAGNKKGLLAREGLVER